MRVDLRQGVRVGIRVCMLHETLRYRQAYRLSSTRLSGIVKHIDFHFVGERKHCRNFNAYVIKNFPHIKQSFDICMYKITNLVLKL